MKNSLLLFLLTFSIIGITQTNIKTPTTLKIVTWNIQNLGRTKDAEEIHSIAKIIKNYDIIALQEVTAKDPKGAQAVAKIADELNRMGDNWTYTVSDPTKSPSPNISERYAYLWRKSKIQLLGKAHLDSELDALIDREPFIAEFKLKNDTNSFYLVNFHAKTHNHSPETEIEFFKHYPKRLKSEHVIIMGDFNLNGKHSVWNSLYQQGYKPSLSNTPTTLKRNCVNTNYFNHSIDNIYYNTKAIKYLNSGRIDFVKNCDNLEKARQLSDHVPVFLEFSIK